MAELRATSVDGAPVTALDDGTGPALILVHGGAEGPGRWDRVTRELVDDFRVVRVARRIYLPGAAVPPTYSVALEAADVLAVAGLVDGPRLLVGHSSGAVAALEAAVRAPEALSGLLLYEPPVPTRSLVGPEVTRRGRAALAAGDVGEAMRIHLRDVAQEPEELVAKLTSDPRARAVFAAKAAAGFDDIDALDALGTGVARYRRMEVPTTLVQGDRSPARIRRQLADLASALPNARVVTLAGQGHIAHRTAPEAMAHAIREAARCVGQGMD